MAFLLFSELDIKIVDYLTSNPKATAYEVVKALFPKHIRNKDSLIRYRLKRLISLGIAIKESKYYVIPLNSMTAGPAKLVINGIEINLGEVLYIYADDKSNIIFLDLYKDKDGNKHAKNKK